MSTDIAFAVIVVRVVGIACCVSQWVRHSCDPHQRVVRVDGVVPQRISDRGLPLRGSIVGQRSRETIGIGPIHAQQANYRDRRKM
jgi:hypothetical protein